MKSHRLNPILHKQRNAVDFSLPTDLLGTDIGFIQALLGYNTKLQGYTRISHRILKRIKSPIDHILEN